MKLPIILLPALGAGVVLALAGLLVSGAAGLHAQEPAETVAEGAADAPVLNTYVLPRSGPFSPDQIAIPNAGAISSWARSGHADAGSEAFTHWDDAGTVPAACASCHSGAGFRSFHGLDGSPPGLPAEGIPTGSVVDCGTCHDAGLSRVTQITLPSGVAHPVTPSDAACTTCHQGRAAGATVTRAIGDRDEDTPDPALSFVNPHYAVAASSLLGGYGGGGYHYPGKTYSGRFLHAKPVATCVSCHDPHALTVAADTCLTCHQSGDPKAIRLSRQSHDGSGDLSKGIRVDITANADRLMGLIGAYAGQVLRQPLVYDGARHPYFFADANGDGLADQADGRPVPYAGWSPRLLKAAYNWKYVGADKGIHVHNPHYALELLYDSIESLAAPLGVDFDALNLAR